MAAPSPPFLSTHVTAGHSCPNQSGSMASGACPFWQDGHLSLCVQHLFLAWLLPIAACGLSLVLLGVSLMPRFPWWPG